MRMPAPAFGAGDCGSSALPCDRDEAVLAGKSRPNGVGNSGYRSQESAKAIVVDRYDGDGWMRLFHRHALVRGHEGREAAVLRYGQKFVVAERTPVVKNGGFDDDTAEPLLEWMAQARRHTDVKENLHARVSGGGDAVGIPSCGGADRRGSSTQNGCDRPGIDLKVAQELVHRNAVLDPVEELLDGKARTSETGHTAHACGIDPNRFFKRHGTIRACFGRRLHGRSRVRAQTSVEEHTLGGGGVQ